MLFLKTHESFNLGTREILDSVFTTVRKYALTLSFLFLLEHAEEKCMEASYIPQTTSVLRLPFHFLK